MEFFDKFCDPTTIGQLTLSQKMLASLFVTLLGMGITFVGLVVIQYMIQLTSKVIKFIENGHGRQEDRREVDFAATLKPEPPVPTEQRAVEETEDLIDEELVAVITAAVAAVMGQKTSNIVISHIRRVEPLASAWSMAGRNEQINSRF